MNIPDNTLDLIDSQDIIARIEELEELGTAVEDARDAYDAAEHDGATDSELAKLQAVVDAAYEDYGRPEADELATLRNLADEASGYCSDWLYGTMLIRESYFVEYAQDLAEDIGATSHNDNWPYGHIDWESAADDLRHDYTDVDFDGVTYLVR